MNRKGRPSIEEQPKAQTKRAETHVEMGACHGLSADLDANHT